MPTQCPIAEKLSRLRTQLRGLGSVAVALSGGVDSSLLLALCVEALGDRAVAVTGVSPSLAHGELDDADAVARHVGARLVRLHTNEMDDPRYVRNAGDRCYFCKSELYDRVRAWADEHGIEHVVDGLNADDDPGDRPGVRAGRERDVISPLRDAGLTKADIRAEAARLRLPTATKPAAPCLASRIPHGTAVTEERLKQVDAAERALRALGFAELRVRHHGSRARIEVPPSDVPRALAERARIAEAICSVGFESVSVDRAGLRSGGADSPSEAQGAEEVL